MQKHPLKVNQLSKKYNEFVAVDSVSFEVKSGEIFGLLGPNGAGKTSIISCIVTLNQPSSGSIEVFGFDPRVSPQEAKLSTGYVPQEIVNHGYFDVEEILKFHSGYYQRWPNTERIKYLLHRVGLYEHRKKKVKSLSGGMKRRLLIAKALVHEPKLLLLDEPTAGVDIELRAILWDFVRELKSQGVAVLLTTHYLEEAESLCDRVGILQSGKLKVVGPTQELVSQLTVKKINIEWRAKDFLLHNSYLTHSVDNKSVYCVPQNINIGEFFKLLNFDQIKDIKVSEGSLEEAVLKVLGDN